MVLATSKRSSFFASGAGVASASRSKAATSSRFAPCRRRNRLRLNFRLPSLRFPLEFELLRQLPARPGLR